MTSIRKRLTLSFLLVVLVPLIITTLFSFKFLLMEVEAEALSNLREDIKVATLIFQNKLTQLKEFARITSLDRGLKTALQHKMPEKISEHLSVVTEMMESVELTVTDMKGDMVTQLPESEPESKNLKNDIFIKKALTGDHPAASEAVKAPEGNETASRFSLTTAYPIFDRDGFMQIGVLRVRYYVGKSSKLLNKISGAIMGRVDIFLGEQPVASSTVGAISTRLTEEGLSEDVIEKTLKGNEPYEEIYIARNGYLAEFKPITDVNYQPIGILAIQTPSQKYYYLRTKSITSLALISLAMIVLGFLIGYWLQGGITRPIITLTERTRAVAQGDFSKGMVQIKSRDEIGVLSTSFNKMTKDLLLYIENLKKTTAERERMSKELEIGQQIQQTFLPQTFPELERTEIFGQSIPAREVGGDFFDVFMLDNRRIGLVIADVSGKGVPAALFMALSRSVLRVTALEGHDPRETLNRVNNFVSQDNDSCMFVTTFYAVFDIETGELTYSNAGHNPPFVFKRSSETIEELPLPKGLPLGVMEEFSFKMEHCVLEAGDSLFLYTDGIVEAPNGVNEEFGMERLSDFLLQNHNLSAESQGKLITKEVSEFSKGLEQFDDITFLMMKFR